MALASGTPDSVELVRYDGNSPATADTSLTNIHMEEDHGEDNHVRLMLKAGATLTAGATLEMTVNGTANASCPSGSPAAPSIEWKLTVQAGWATRSADNLRAVSVFMADELEDSSVPVDTGVRIQRSSAVCSRTNVILVNHVDKFELYRYRGNTRMGASGGPRIDDVSMPATGGDNVRVYFKAGVDLRGGVLQVTMDAVAHRSCTDPQTPGVASGISFPITVEGGAPWEARVFDVVDARERFSRYALLDSTRPTATGIQIHRSSSACSSTDVALARGTPSYLGLDLHGDGSGVDLRSSHSGVAMPGRGAGDRHLRLYFAAGATVPNGDHQRDGDIDGGLRGVGRAAGSADSGVSADGLHAGSSMRGRSWGRTARRRDWLRSGGRRWRRGTWTLASGCIATARTASGRTWRLLGGSEHVELARYAANGLADGAPGARLEAVRMDALSGTADRHVRLRFKGAYPPGPVLRVTLRVAAASSCSSRLNPAAETFTYALNINADVNFAPTLSLSSARAVVRPGSNAAAVGLTATATDSGDRDVEVVLDSASARIFELRRTGNAHCAVDAGAGAGGGRSAVHGGVHGDGRRGSGCGAAGAGDGDDRGLGGQRGRDGGCGGRRGGGGGAGAGIWRHRRGAGAAGGRGRRFGGPGGAGDAGGEEG